MSNLPAVAVSFDDKKAMSIALVESGLFGFTSWQQVLAVGMISEAEGQPFVIAVRDYHVIKGKPVLKAEAMLARFQKSGGRMKMIERTDDRVVAEFFHPQGGTITVDWDMERAKVAGLAGKENWMRWKRQMLTARVISEGVRATFPGATGGALAPEEVDDLAPDAARDVTPQKATTGVAALEERIATMSRLTAGAEAATVEFAAAPSIIPTTTDGEFELTPPSVEDQILGQLREAALQGTVDLQGAWDGLSKDYRKKLQEHFPSLKEAAHKVDAEQAAARG